MLKKIIQRRGSSIALSSKKTHRPWGKPRVYLDIRIGRYPGRDSKDCSENSISFQSKTMALEFANKVKESIEEA